MPASNITDGTAYARNTLLGLVTINDQNLAGWEYKDLIQPSALLNALPWYPASAGTQHKYLVETVAPGAAFRAVNTGVANVAGQSKSVSIDLKILDFSFFRDVEIARGYRGGVETYLQMELARSLGAALAKSEYQLIQGEGYDAAGFGGLQDAINLWGLGKNVGGSGGTRVYMLITGEDAICGIVGGASVNESGKFFVSDPALQRILTNVSTGAGYNAFNVNGTGWMGLQVAGSYSAAVAFNIDGTSGKGVTDDLLGELYSLFPSGKQPRINAILMSRVGQKQLQQSRTATNPTGAPAPFPMAWEGAGRPIPIIISDAVNDAESTVTTTTTTTTTTAAT
jgi:hypothetical protein